MIVKRCPMPSVRVQLAEQVLELSSVGEGGICLLFDSDIPSGDWNRRYSDNAFCRDQEKERTAPDAPEHVREALASQNGSHLVWLSRAVCEACNSTFAWVLAHELRHVWQDRNHPNVRVLNEFMATYYSRPFGHAPHGLDLPYELDAEIAAKRIVENKLGATACEEHLKMCSESESGSQAGDALGDREMQWCGDVWEATLELWRRGRFGAILADQQRRGRHTQLRCPDE